MDYNPYLLNSKPYFISALNSRLAELEAQGKQIISLIMGDPLEPSYEPARQAVIEALQNNPVSQYPKPPGTPAYRQAVADWAKRTYDVDYSPETEIISCKGSKEAIFHLPLLFDWKNGREMWIPSLSYPVYESAARTYDVPVRILPLNAENGFMPDLDSFSPEDWQQCQMFWINSPHNPTTAIASKAYLEKLVALAEQYDFLVCSDECYNDLYYNESPPASCLEIESQNLLVLRSLSKRSHITGYRMGALLSKNTEMIRLLAKLRTPIGVGIPQFIEPGGIAAWSDDQHPRDFTERYRLRRDRLVSALEAKGFDVFGAQAGFYLWFSHPKLTRSDAILEAFIDAGLLITPGTAFGDDGEGYARLIYCITNDLCEQVIERIGQIQI